MCVRVRVCTCVCVCVCVCVLRKRERYIMFVQAFFEVTRTGNVNVKKDVQNQKTSSNIIAGNDRVLESYWFINWLNLFIIIGTCLHI